MYPVECLQQTLICGLDGRRGVRSAVVPNISTLSPIDRIAGLSDAMNTDRLLIPTTKFMENELGFPKQKQ